MHNPEFLHFRCPGHISVCRSSKLGGAGIWAVGEKLPLGSVSLHGRVCISVRGSNHGTLVKDNIPLRCGYMGCSLVGIYR